MDDDELERRFARGVVAFQKHFPKEALEGDELGFYLLVFKRSSAGTTEGSELLTATNVARPDAPEVLHELADHMEQENDAEDAEDLDESGDE